MFHYEEETVIKVGRCFLGGVKDLTNEGTIHLLLQPPNDCLRGRLTLTQCNRNQPNGRQSVTAPASLRRTSAYPIQPSSLVTLTCLRRPALQQAEPRSPRR